MTERSLAVVLDVYASSWGALSERGRLHAFAACLAEDFVYTDPNTRTVGYSALGDYMDGFQLQLPGAGFVNRTIAEHHDCLLVGWDMVDATGAVLSPGASYGIRSADGRLAAMTGFFDQ